ncbi:hypothetical protein G6M89_14795 [Natronolimnobius sp. AArcel1]|uniref:hypothetical protein n=1 Tax=Natronolimnobius sp. AArcel1 TaxID=1679093 RepID=UPI0013E9C2D3|nr:hypothetical protein [Natronolimnobius sp. AArcel1]NGM70262.1 hypothetical protein [Natronolimnobius sp. AArcel1]
MSNLSNSNRDKSIASSSSEDSEKDALEKVPATSYVPRIQYEKWKGEAENRDQSISTLIATMVEAGLNDIELEDESPSEIVDLRSELQEVRSERDDLYEKLQRKERGDFQVGLGRVKELIIENPGIDRREIINFVMENPVLFVDSYLESLETSEFRKQNGKWFPPESVEVDE